MAVEAPPHSHLFSPQFLSNNNREMIDQGNKNVYGNDAKFGYGMVQMVENNGMFPMYVSNNNNNGMMMDMNTTVPVPVPAVALKADDSGLTYSLPISRKRSRESSSFDPASGLSFPNAQFVVDQNHQMMINDQKAFMFLGEDVSMQIYQQQLDIDRFIANHTEKVRTEIEATRRRNSMRLIAAAEEGINKRLRSKEEEIIKIAKLNSALEEKVKSLNIENQLWQQMAQTNEATANNLRRNLHRILTQIQQQQNRYGDHNNNNNTVDDVQSCCGSNYDEEKEEHKSPPLMAENGGNNDNNNNDDDVDSKYYSSSRSNSDNNGRKVKRWCRNCGKMESCVLLLPCRHLCICSECESAINVCPICKSSKNATLHVNMTC